MGQVFKAIVNQGLKVKTVQDRDLQRVRVITWFMNLVEKAVPDVIQRNLLTDMLPRLVEDYPEEKSSSYGWARKSWLERLKTESAKGDERARAILAQLSAADYVALGNIDKAHYERGDTSPSEQTLKIFEKIFKYSESLYTDGPDGMPLWLVLDGNQAACQEFFNDVAAAGNFGPDIDTVILQWLFDELIEPQYRVDVNNIPNLFQAPIGSHPISLSFIERKTSYPFNDKSPEEEILAWSRYDQAVLMAIAVWRIVFERGITRYMRQMEWLLVGLCLGILGIRYNQAVQAYVFSKVQAYGYRMDSLLSDFDMKVLPFDERWRRFLG